MPLAYSSNSFKIDPFWIQPVYKQWLLQYGKFDVYSIGQKAYFIATKPAQHRLTYPMPAKSSTDMARHILVPVFFIQPLALIGYKEHLTIQDDTSKIKTDNAGIQCR